MKSCEPEYILTKYPDAKLDRETVLKALSNESAVIIGVSGKICSGKDTVSDALFSHYLTDTEYVNDSFAYDLRAELNEIIAGVLQGKCACEVASSLGASVEDVERVVNMLRFDVLSGRVTNSYVRTDTVRKALQYWGTGVRRKQNELYWVSNPISRSLNRVASGCSVVFTDVRFPSEAQAILDMGGVMVRLNVSKEEQARRVLIRDGLVMEEGRRLHVSETSLDDFDGFDIVVNTDEFNSPDEVAKKIASVL